MYLDTMTYLPLDILTKVDRMTMAHSLEARPPLLDHTLVERVFACRRRSSWRRDGTQKAIFKHAVADLLPPEILTRHKRGFGVPIVKWFRGALKAPMQELLGDRRFVRARLARRRAPCAPRRRAPRRPPRSRAADLWA